MKHGFLNPMNRRISPLHMMNSLLPKKIQCVIGCLFALLSISVQGEGLKTFPSKPADALTHARLRQMWDLDRLYQPPQTWSAESEGFSELKTPNGTIRPLFFEGEPYEGKPTRVFAWIGVPAGATKSKPVPGIVLVHGGGGTAFRDWVRMWVDRGYAAVAMDTDGTVPDTPDGCAPPRHRHQWAGPADSGRYAEALKEPREQGPYHAVAAVIRAHSLLRATPGVDPERIGITGISWGSVWTEMVAGIDERFKFFIPIYGSGFHGEATFPQQNDFQYLPESVVKRWLELWDPSQYVGFAKIPSLFVTGTNDHYFFTPSWQKTVDLAGEKAVRSLQLELPHGHPPAGDPKEALIFADSVLGRAPALPKITGFKREGDKASIEWDSKVPVRRVELMYTADCGPWPQRKWNALPARMARGIASATIPANASVFYFNLYDARDCVVSSNYLEQSPQ